MTRSPTGTARLAAVLLATSVAGQGSVRPAPVAGELLAAGQYDRAEVMAREEVERSRASYGQGAIQVSAASDVLARALILNGRAASDETLALVRRTLHTRETRVGTDSPALVSSLLNLGDVHIATGEFQQAVTFTERAVGLLERHTSEPLDQAEGLDHLGAALSAAGRYDDALKVLDRGLRLKERSPTVASAAVARTLEEIGLAYQRTGAYERAGPMLRRAASLRDAAGPGHPAFATTLNLLAQQLWFEGQLVESRNTSERAVAVAQRTLRPDHPTTALSLRYLAATLADLGDTSRALALKGQALAIAERDFGPGHYLTAPYLQALAMIELNEGAYASARQHFGRVLSIVEKRYGPWHGFVATTLSTLARADASLGDYASARRELARAVAVHARVGGPNHPFVAGTLTELAVVYRDRGSPAEALPLLERALAIRERSLGSSHRDVAQTLADMAATLMLLGRPGRANLLAARARSIWEQLDAPDAPKYATVLALDGNIQLSRGRYASAKDYFERSLQIRGRVFGASHPDYAEAQIGLAMALANLHQGHQALTLATDAESAGRDHLRLMLRSLPERQALNYAAVRPRGLNVILSLADSLPDATPVALEGVIRSRALVLDEVAARRSTLGASGEGTDSARRALSSAQERLANLTVRGPGQMSTVQYGAALEDARRDSEVAESALAERSEEFRAQRRRAQIGVAEVMKSLPADAALVSFVRYERTVFRDAGAMPLRERARTSSRPTSSYLAFVVRHNQPAVVVPVGSVRIIDTLVSQWRTDLAAEGMAPAQLPSGGSVRSSRGSGAVLRRRVWDRLATHLGDARRVFIVPDGTLSLLPFAALPVGQRSYLLETGPAVHYLSAERDLVPSSETSAELGLLALGGASFDDPTLFAASAKPAIAAKAGSGQAATLRGALQICGDLRSVTFPPLNGTTQEVRDLSVLWRNGAKPESGAARVLVGRDASEAMFKREAHRYRVLHLATHGFFLSDACSPTATGTRGVGRLVGTRPTNVENPLLLSGIALAGANRRVLASPDEDDGILTAEEVASLNLQGVEWAVLSACDTGVGEIKAGEGVLGLRRAFQVAGARTVIMSLWSVEDQSTRVWMRALYDGRIRRNLDTAAAVHEASLAVLHARRAKGQNTSPFYWAAFVAAGDWR